MKAQIRGLAERGESLYLIAGNNIIELDNPETGTLTLGSITRKLTPPAALYPFITRRVQIHTTPTTLQIRHAGATATVKAETIITQKAHIARSKSLALAGWIAENLLPGIPYYDAVTRTPSIAVPTWATKQLIQACTSIPLLNC